MEKSYPVLDIFHISLKVVYTLQRSAALNEPRMNTNNHE